MTDYGVILVIESDPHGATTHLTIVVDIGRQLAGVRCGDFELLKATWTGNDYAMHARVSLQRVAVTIKTIPIMMSANQSPQRA